MRLSRALPEGNDLGDFKNEAPSSGGPKNKGFNGFGYTRTETFISQPGNAWCIARTCGLGTLKPGIPCHTFTTHLHEYQSEPFLSEWAISISPSRSPS